MGGRGTYKRFWWESQKERDHYEDLELGGGKILRWNLRNRIG
jgi:hypothetical protein